MEGAGVVNVGEAGAPGFAAPPGALRRSRLALVLVGAVLFLWRVGSHDLWPPDEPRFGLVAKEMWTSGDHVVLSLNQGLYTDKPPLFFWAINLFAALRGGVDEWAARLPSALCGIVSLLLVLQLGVWLFDRLTGLLGALIFATSLQVIERARWASIDMTLTCLVLAAIVCFWRGRIRPQSADRCNRSAWLLMGLATLAKGPVGLLLPLLAVLPVMLLERDWRGVRRLLLPSGILLYLAVTLGWFVPWARRLGLETAIAVTWHQTAERYVDAWNGHHPFWYYLWQFPVNFVPWILFLPAALRQAFASEERPHRRAALFLTGWLAAIFLFFSFSTGKRGVYILPLYPAASLLVARLFTAAEARAGAPTAGAAAARRLRAPLVGWLILAAGLGAGLPLYAALRFPGLVFAAGLIGAALLVGAIAARATLRRGHPPAAASALAVSMVAVLLVAIAQIQPFVDRHENLRPFARRVEAALGPGESLGATEQKREAWVFYTGRFAVPLDTDAAIVAYLREPGPRALVIEEAKLGAVRERLPGDVVEVLGDRVAGQDYHLLRRAGAP